MEKEFSGMTVVLGNVKAEWVDCDEGLCGDYNPDDPEDVQLLRFDVSINHDGQWEEVDDASYCTLMPVDTEPAILQKALNVIAKEYHNILGDDEFASVKKLGEHLSWISPDYFNEKEK